MKDCVVDFRDLVKEYPKRPAQKDGVIGRLKAAASGRGLFRAVDSVSGSIEKGAVTAIIGGNGAGKSTLLEMIACVRHPTSGSMTVFGQECTGDCASIRSRIGYLPQALELFRKLTVRENLRYFRAAHQSADDIDDVMRRYRLEAHSDKLYEVLSGGLKQRVCIACISMGNPELMLMDEPFTGVDPDMRTEIWGIIRGLRDSGVTVVLTTHHVSEAHLYADNIIRMEHGRIVSSGPTTKMRTSVSLSFPDPEGSICRGLDAPLSANVGGITTLRLDSITQLHGVFGKLVGMGVDLDSTVVDECGLSEGGVL